jgi:hypothetical protein
MKFSALYAGIIIETLGKFFILGVVNMKSIAKIQLNILFSVTWDNESYILSKNI